MRQYRVRIAARKEGAIGQHGTERRSYVVETDDPEKISDLAIAAAYHEGGIEHVRVLSVEPML